MDLSQLINRYNELNLNFLSGNFLREDLFLKDILFNIIRSGFLTKYPREDFPRSRSSIPNQLSREEELKNWTKIKNKLRGFLKEFLPIEITFDLAKAEYFRIMASNIVETLFYLERAIFWFFNYKYNMIKGHEIAGIQARYYSDFSIKVSILKLLGFSISHTKFGTFRIHYDFDNKKIILNNFKGSSSEHEYFNNTFIEIIKILEFSKYPKIIEKIIEERKYDGIIGIKKEVLINLFVKESKTDRMDQVYDVTSRFSDPFKSYSSMAKFNELQNYCFLEGPDRYYDPPPYPDEEYEEYYANTFIPDIYGDWGYIENAIGDKIYFVIECIKDLKNSSYYLNILIQKINGFEKYDKEVKEIINK